MKPPVQVSLVESSADGHLTRKLILEDIAVPGAERAETWWRIPENLGVEPLRVWDSLVCGHLLWASTLGQDLVVHGPMSATGLYNLHQLVEIRCALQPHRYKPIRITADTVPDAAPLSGGRGRVLAAYSGGLDSTFTVIRHARGLPGDRTYPLDGLVLVLGFDIPRQRKDRLAALRKRLDPVVKSLGLALHVVETNALELGSGTWPQSAMPLFGSVLAQCAGPGGVGLVSAGSPYGTAHFSLSHVPPMDDLCSNEDFRLVTDGGGFGRADKAAALLAYPDILSSLRVCWQGPDPARNCGVCPKCIMTRINFLAAGLENPPCFDTPLTPEHIARLPLASLFQARDFFRFCLVELDARGVQHPVATLLRRRLSRVPPDHVAPTLWKWVGRARALASSGRRSAAP